MNETRSKVSDYQSTDCKASPTPQISDWLWSLPIFMSIEWMFALRSLVKQNPMKTAQRRNANWMGNIQIECWQLENAMRVQSKVLVCVQLTLLQPDVNKYAKQIHLKKYT